MEASYVLFTLFLIIVAATYVVAIIFFKRMYYLIVEVEARLIQIRNMMEAQANPNTKRRATGGASASQQTKYGTPIR